MLNSRNLTIFVPDLFYNQLIMQYIIRQINSSIIKAIVLVLSYPIAVGVTIGSSAAILQFLLSHN